ncbi:hypothetical protein L2E82_07968 [Cichorium intybus]|uniref:Uncharacterized protein n=1 Tax=Cichorium intybus TaxID=13427 RepID=A0ACB9G4Y2_CICIN|nr:hypothetical protein L2E82_07968 [Cichorium intybus]
MAQESESFSRMEPIYKISNVASSDVDRSIVWTSNTTRKHVAAMNLTSEGDLVLSDGDNWIVWQSFDHPTDCLVVEQELHKGQKLITSVTSTNSTAQKEIYSLQLTDKGLFAYVESNPPQIYWRYLVKDLHIKPGGDEFVPDFLLLTTGDLCIYPTSAVLADGCLRMVDSAQIEMLQYLKLMPDGHLKAFGWDEYGKGRVTDVVMGDHGECSYPLACGRNAICSGNQQCSCPGTDSFRAVDGFQPKKGCFPVTPLTCNATQHQSFIEIKNVTYVTYSTDMKNVDLKTCKQACLNNCSCKAAIFKYYGSNSSNGSCDLPSELFTMNVDARVRPSNNVSAFIKVQNVTSTPSSISTSPRPLPEKKNHVATILGSVIGSFVLLLVVVVGFTKFIIQKRKMDSEIEEEYLDQVPGMPTRFSYEDLKIATEWLSSIITEKMDVYSFGIVLLEILCGRKNVDRSQPEESWHLLHVFQSCWEQGTLLSIVDKYSEDMQVHATEVMEMMKVAAWCLQTDYMKRPSMSTVMKVLEGVMNVESNLDYNFLDPRMQRTIIEREKSSKPLLPSILSGPR